MFKVIMKVHLSIFSFVLIINIVYGQQFKITHSWQFVNFSWPNEKIYEKSIKDNTFIPGNVVIAGIKLFKNRIYVAMPKIRNGVPATLGFIEKNIEIHNPLVHPYPNWSWNDATVDCSNLQSVQSMEIDKSGTMWIIDGVRNNNKTNCPAKLVFVDLITDKMVHSLELPSELGQGAFLNDIVVDDSNGGFAYITDNQEIDPGLLVYSKKTNSFWKLRNNVMFAERNAVGFVVGGVPFGQLSPIDGIALSPSSSSSNISKRFVYFCALTAFNLYSISTEILKNEEVCQKSSSINITLIGRKQSQTDGMMMDNNGNLYYTLLPLYGVGVWNENELFNNSKIIDQQNTMEWTDSFGFDSDEGYLYLLTNNIVKFFNVSYDFRSLLNSSDPIRIFKLHTNTKSYVY